MSDYGNMAPTAPNHYTIGQFRSKPEKKVVGHTDTTMCPQHHMLRIKRGKNGGRLCMLCARANPKLLARTERKEDTAYQSLTEEDKEEIIKLIRNGESDNHIAEQKGCDSRVIVRVRKEESLGPGLGNKISPETKARIREEFMNDPTLSYKSLAKMFGCSRDGVVRSLKTQPNLYVKRTVGGAHYKQ